MTDLEQKAIKYAESCGMTYHVFCDINSYDDDGRYTGRHQYRTSFSSYEPARKLADAELNGVVYDSSCQTVGIK